jgi:hypothetical protein
VRSIPEPPQRRAIQQGASILTSRSCDQSAVAGRFPVRWESAARVSGVNRNLRVSPSPDEACDPPDDAGRPILRRPTVAVQPATPPRNRIARRYGSSASCRSGARRRPRPLNGRNRHRRDDVANPRDDRVIWQELATCVQDRVDGRYSRALDFLLRVSIAPRSPPSRGTWSTRARRSLRLRRGRGS